MTSHVPHFDNTEHLYRIEHSQETRLSDDTEERV